MAQGFNNLDFNTIYRNWINNQIETANARGLLPEGSTRFLQNEQVKSIDDIINKAYRDLGKTNRGVAIGNQPMVNLGPTSKSVPKQLPALWEPNFTLGENGAMKTGKSVPTISKQVIDSVNKAKPALKLPALPAKPMDPLSATTMLLDAWFGTNAYGVDGIGKTILKQTPWGQLIYGKPEPSREMIEGYEATKKFFNGGNKSYGKNANESELNKSKTNGGANVKNGSSTQISKQVANTTDLQQQPVQQLVTEQQPNIDAINNYVQQLQNINRPYIEALQSYVNNYDKNLADAQRAQRYFTGLAGWTGNNRWGNVANIYNPIVNEANRINAVKQLQDAQAGDINAINEVMGNMALAKEMDLPYEAAFANKNLLTALTANRRNLTDWEKAQLAAELKRYGIDVEYNKAMAQQALRNKGALDVALTNAAAFGGGVPGLTAQGTMPTQKEMSMAQALSGK